MAAAVAALVAGGTGVFTNYVTAKVPAWAENPWLVWTVFGVMVLASVALQVWSRRLDGGGAASARLVPVSRVVAGVMESLAAPHTGGPVRGREADLAELRRLLRRPQGRFAVLCGAGGLGKTTVAASLAEQARADGTAVFWIRWRDEQQLAEHMVRIAVACGMPEEQLEAARAGRLSLPDAVWEQLAQAGRWLIVLDNVDEPEALGSGGDPVGTYRGWIRPVGSGLLLVTSRNTDSGTWGGAAVLRRLTPLEGQAGSQVLMDGAPDAGTAEEARALAERLGGLPLALHAAGRYLAAAGSRYRTYATYMEALDRELSSLLGAEHPRAADPEVARAVVRHTWELSLDQLTDGGNTLARPVLRLLSLLGAAPVPLSFVTPDLVTAATGSAASEVAVEAAVNGLHTYGLVDAVVGETGGPAGLVVLHPLVREISALALSGEVAHPEHWHAALAGQLGRTVQDVTAAGRAGWATARVLAPHALAVAGLDGCCDDLAVASTLSTLADHMDEAGQPIGYHRLAQEAESIRNRVLGPVHLDTLDSRNNLANALYELGRYQEAADLHQQTLTDIVHILGPDHPHALTSSNNVANVLYELGQHQEAADLHQQTLTDRTRIIGPDHPDTLSSRNNLAIALFELERYQEAADLHQQTLTDRTRTLGPDHPDTLSSRNNLANVFHKLGQYQEAADLHQQTLTDRTHILGPDHPHTLSSRNNVANMLSELGQYQEAADLHQQTLTDRTRTLGPDHPDTLNSRNNLAIALYELERYQESADLHQQALNDRTRTLGPDHPDTLDSRHNLASAQQAAQRRSAPRPLRRAWRRITSRPAP
ncbi:FxSxx-COOH system tetratricopeptide repeat protein [Streptomyces sp. NPDC090022]|uniref:FxSxx-COOH system tetratricopeptide repeat protein n=1 Tax=Streptomyces sp. NPDC090022 TaxID=3365920 RepID=UPI0038233BB4